MSEKMVSVSKSISASILRVGLEPVEPNLILTDIEREFKSVDVKSIQEAIRLGSTGKYGRTYRLTSQEVCFWIREYLKEKNKPLGPNLLTGAY